MSKKSVFTKKIICAFGVISLVMGLTACGATKSDEEKLVTIETGDEEMTYNLVEVVRDDVIKTANIRVTYTQTAEQEVYFPVSGKLVDKVYVKEGDSVKKGDLLVELSSGSLEDEIARLEYNIKRNEMQLEYLDTNENLDIQARYLTYLYHSGQSEWELEMVKSDVESIQTNYADRRENYEDSLEFDRMELAQKKRELSQSRVYAELDGVVTKVLDNLEGSTSNIDKVVMTIIDNSEGLFEAKDPDYMNYFTEGVPANMTISVGKASGAYELMPYNMENWGEKQYFTIFSSPDDVTVEVGNSGYLNVVLDERKNVLTLPINCIYRAEDKYYVYILNDDGMRDAVWVEIGLYEDTNAEILSGLEEGEKVIKKS